MSEATGSTSLNKAGIKPAQPGYTPITTRSTPTGPQYVLHPHAHDPRSLAAAAVASFSRPCTEWSFKQRTAMGELHHEVGTLLEGPLFDRAYGFPGHAEPPPATLMKRLIDLCSDVFFLGALHRVEFEWDAALVSHAKCIGRCVYNRDSGRCMISMDSNFFLDQVELPPGRHIFDTLLHECLHAILALYCHRDPTTSPPGIFPATGIERLGLTGHGSIWTELGSHVEFTAQCFLNRDIDLVSQKASFTKLEFRARFPALSPHYVGMVNREKKS